VWRREKGFQVENESDKGRGNTTEEEKGEILDGRTTKITYEYLCITLIIMVTFSASSATLLS
jgi:hypothetical protein